MPFMKKIKLVPACCLLLLAMGAQAQAKREKEHFKFSSINTAGIILGDAEKELALQSINGVRYQGWFAGVGAGLDYYYQRSVPLFVDLRKLIFPAKTPLFVYADAGVNVPWPTKRDKERTWLQPDFKTGLYYEAGAGLFFQLPKTAIVFSGGLSVKEMREIQTYDAIWGRPGLPGRQDKVDYHLSRLVLKAGFQF